LIAPQRRRLQQCRFNIERGKANFILLRKLLQQPQHRRLEHRQSSPVGGRGIDNNAYALWPRDQVDLLDRSLMSVFLHSQFCAFEIEGRLPALVRRNYTRADQGPIGNVHLRWRIRRHHDAPSDECYKTKTDSGEAHRITLQQCTVISGSSSG
jgi:hypothetical protein